MQSALFILTETLPQIPEESVAALSQYRVTLLDVSDSGLEQELPENWERLDVSNYVDPDAFRKDFLQFLEDCPRTPVDGRCFDEMFRRRDGYSVWWTTVGSMRTRNRFPTRQMHMIWVVDRVLQALGFEAVLVYSKSETLSEAMVSRCVRSEVSVESHTCTVGSGFDPAGVGWFLRQLCSLLVRPIKELTLVAIVRLSLRLPRESGTDLARPAICFRPRIARSVEFENGVPMLPFWLAFCREAKDRCPDLRQRFLLRQKKSGEGIFGMIRWLRKSGIALYKSFDGAIPPAIGYSGVGRYLLTLPMQIRSLATYAKMERKEEYRDSFCFANANVFAIYGPLVREAVESIASWESASSSIEKAFRKVGNLSAVLVLAEFYRGVMPGIAASSRLGIPTIGVQHGTIMPSHLQYTVPRGQVLSAPVPDYFAAYGSYAKHVVSEVGHFPSDRVWNVGVPRLDRLVLNPPSQNAARQKLGLPADKVVLLIATQRPKWFPQAVAAIFQAVSSREECVVCVKAHYGDRKRLGLYRELAEKAGLETAYFYEDQFDELLAACDVLISASSTTVLEATLLGRKTISVNFSNEADRYPYVTEGASLPGRSVSEVFRSIDLILSDESEGDLASRRRAFLEGHAGPTADGLGSATLIDKLCEIVPIQNLTN